MSFSSAAVSGTLISRGSFAAFSASLMMASITGWKWRWPDITYAPPHRMDASESLLPPPPPHRPPALVSRHDEVELTFRHLVQHRIEHVFVVDEADAAGADRTHEGRARKREGRRGRDHRQNIGI